MRILDLAGRPRGIGFVADHRGTVVTGHEAVDGLARLVLHSGGDRSRVVSADAVTALPELDLALIRAEGLGVDPLPVSVRDTVETGTYVRLPAGCWREARVLGTASVTYTATDRFHLLEDVLELAIGTAGRDALRLGGGAAGGPVLDAETGAVVAVLGTALQCGHRDSGYAVPLRSVRTGPLADLLAENAATVPAYGADLNLAGVLELTATSIGQDGPPGTLAGHVGRADPTEPVERTAVTREFAAFTEGPAGVLGLVGPPGSGRTTQLAALAARRHRSSVPAPTLWLRGADLEDTDASVADAASRALTRAARIVASSTDTVPADLGDLTPERLARLSGTAGRPLFLLLDGPEEMPPVLAHRLAEWTQGTVKWLAETGARLVVACREEYWEGADFPEELLYGTSEGHLPPCVRLADLTDEEARRARARHTLPEGILTAPDDRHPLTLRLLSEVRAALPDAPHAPADRDEVFSAYLDLMCLRIAVRLATASGLRGAAVRRLAAKVSGQVHEAARRSLGPGHGELDRESFEAVFPWGPAPKRLGGTGWASAVLTEGLLVPAGSGYRFAHEELADWIQGTHLDLDEALRVLVHRHRTEREDPLPVPHHRIGPVVQALLLVARQHGAPQLAHRLEELLHALDADPHSWWAARLLTETLLRVPDATPYTDVLRRLTDRLVDRRRQEEPVPPAFGPAFWTALPLPPGNRFELLRRLVLADGPPHEPGPRFLDAVAELLATDPTAVQPHLTRWFDDERPLPATPHATVAEAAQALLHTHRTRALDDLTEVLVGCAHRRADELLAVLAEDEPSAVCRAVDRWAHDERRHGGWRRWRTDCGPPRTYAPRPTANSCATPPSRCSPAPRTAPCTAVRSPCWCATRARVPVISRRRSGTSRPATRGSRPARWSPRSPPTPIRSWRPSGSGCAGRVPGRRCARSPTSPRPPWPAGWPCWRGRRSSGARRPPVTWPRTSTGASTRAPPPGPYSSRWSADCSPAPRNGCGPRWPPCSWARAPPPRARCARNSSISSWTTNGSPRSWSPCCPRPPRAVGTASATSSGAPASSSSAPPGRVRFRPRSRRPRSARARVRRAGGRLARRRPAGVGGGGRPQHPADDREPGGCTGSRLTPRASGHSPHADASDGHAAWHP